jgi:putative transcriptional regulator
VKNNQWLVDLRTARNLTQENVAELVGIDRSYYTKIENGTTPSVRVAKRIASVLGFNWTNFFEQNCDYTSQNNFNEQSATSA